MVVMASGLLVRTINQLFCFLIQSLGLLEAVFILLAYSLNVFQRALVV